MLRVLYLTALKKARHALHYHPNLLYLELMILEKKTIAAIAL
jgi:hypothetical protein